MQALRMHVEVAAAGRLTSMGGNGGILTYEKMWDDLQVVYGRHKNSLHGQAWDELRLSFPRGHLCRFTQNPFLMVFERIARELDESEREKVRRLSAVITLTFSDLLIMAQNKTPKAIVGGQQRF